jgi:hypothetical protein
LHGGEVAVLCSHQFQGVAILHQHTGVGSEWERPPGVSGIADVHQGLYTECVHVICEYLQKKKG